MKRLPILTALTLMCAASLGCHSARMLCGRGPCYGPPAAPCATGYNNPYISGFGAACGPECAEPGFAGPDVSYSPAPTFDDAYLAPPSVDVLPGPVVP